MGAFQVMVDITPTKYKQAAITLDRLFILFSCVFSCDLYSVVISLEVVSKYKSINFLNKNCPVGVHRFDPDIFGR